MSTLPYSSGFVWSGFGPAVGTVDSSQVRGGDGKPELGAAAGDTGIAAIEQVQRVAGPGANYIPLSVGAGTDRASYRWTPAGGIDYVGLDWGLFSTYRRMLSHSTIALAAAFVVNEILQATVDVQGMEKDTPPEWVDLVRRMYLPQRRAVFGECVRSLWYGFKPLEKVWSQRNGELWCDLKAHYPDYAQIYLDRATGLYAGMTFGGFGSEVLPPNRTLPIVFGMEAGNLFGSSLLDNAFDAYNDWGRNQIDLYKTGSKLSGILPVLKYPPGTTPVVGPDGTTKNVDNSIIAKNILDSLGMGNGVALPAVGYDAKAIQNNPALAKATLWELDFQDNGSLSPAVAGFLSVKESLKRDLVNALGLPERALMEGEHGTKAEAGVHSENTVPMIESAIGTILDQLNHGIPTMGVTGAVDDVLLYNFGPKAMGQVELRYTPIDNSKVGVVQSILSVWINATDPAKSIAIAKGVDINKAFTDCGFTLRDSSSEVEDEGPGIDVDEYETAAAMQGPQSQPADNVEDDAQDALGSVRANGTKQAERLDKAGR